MQDYYVNMMREVDNHISTIDLNGTHIIDECKTTILFLKEKLTGLKAFFQLRSGRNRLLQE